MGERIRYEAANETLRNKAKKNTHVHEMSKNKVEH
jgi:hypothetical protein